MIEKPATYLKFTLGSAVALLVLILGWAMAQSTDSDISVISYELVSSERVGRTTFDYQYSLSIRNDTDTDAEDVTITVTSPTSSVSVIDGTVTIALLNAGETIQSDDTITVRVDRRTPFSPSNLEAEISFETSLAGADVNENGVRDDVEAVITDEFNPGTPEYEMSMDVARSYQELIVRLHEMTDNEVYIDYANRVSSSYCLKEVSPTAKGFLLKVFSRQFDTSERRELYNNFRTQLASFGGIAMPSYGDVVEYCAANYGVNIRDF